MSQQKEIEVTNVYERNACSKAPYLVNIGGARSSKSYSIGQLIVQRFWNEKNKKILVCRKTGPALRLTAYKLVVDLLKAHGHYPFVKHDKSHWIITNPYNGTFIAFLSVDDPEKIKSTEWNYIWIEEASEFTWDDWLIIQTRLSGATVPEEPNQIILSLNPSDEQGWINQKLILGPVFARKVDVIRSTYRDNPFLSDEFIEILQSLKEQDPNAFRIYAEGLWGSLSNIIYAAYQVVKELPALYDEVIYGLDFGFNNPSALIRIGIKDVRDHYLDQKLYQTGLTNQALIERMQELIPESERACPIYADCAEPDRIEEIGNAGFNVYPADKEVKNGIDFCKRKHFFTVAANVDLNKERGSYKWRQDRNGNVLDEPVKYMDHLMDAKRYAIYTHYKERMNEPGYA